MPGMTALEEAQAAMRFRVAQAKLKKEQAQARLEKEQAAMRRRVARRRKAARLKRAPVPREMREFQILYTLHCFTNHTASYEDLILTGRCRPFGRGWWRKTFWKLEEDGKLEFIEIRGRELVRLTEDGLSFVINQLRQHTLDILSSGK